MTGCATRGSNKEKECKLTFFFSSSHTHTHAHTHTLAHTHTHSLSPGCKAVHAHIAEKNVRLLLVHFVVKSAADDGHDLVQRLVVAAGVQQVPGGTKQRMGRQGAIEHSFQSLCHLWHCAVVLQLVCAGERQRCTQTQESTGGRENIAAASRAQASENPTTTTRYKATRTRA